jgi:two-component system response regulator MprA
LLKRFEIDYSVCPMADEQSRGKGKAIILVVDRDPHICELEAHFLHEAGYSVEFEKDGDGALEQARKSVPDIIITEILVPTLDGLALCRRIKADLRTRDTAVLVFSILAAAGRAREAGADAFLLKPLAEHTLVETVRQLLEARSARIRRTT